MRNSDLKSGKKPQKLKKQTVHNVVPLALNVPEKYKNCPPDLVWAIPLDMHQDTPEFKAWMDPIIKQAKAEAEAEAHEERKIIQKSKLRLV